MDPKFSEDQLSQLTDEEREGLIDEEDGDDGGDEAEGDNEADAGGDVDKGDEGEGDGIDAEAGADGTDAPLAEQNAATPSVDDPGHPNTLPSSTEEAATPTEHRPRWLENTDIDEKMSAIDKQRDELATKFDEGELSATEYRQQLKPLDDEFRTLDRQKTKLEVQKDNDLDTWKSDVDTFIAKNSQYQDPTLQQMLDTEVRRLQTTATNPLSPSILQQAHKAISDRISKAFNVKADNPKPDTATGKTASARRPEPPPTLRNVPAADQVDIDDSGEFAELDRISTRDSVAYEAALSSLKKSNPAAYDRYMAQ